MKVKPKYSTTNNNSKNIHYRPNSSTKSKLSHHPLSRINNSYSELYPPILLTMPKSRKASHMGNLITKEELYEENMQLKNVIKKAKKDLEEAKTNLFKKGLELDKKEKIINDCHKENVTEIEHEINIHKAKENSLLSKFKKGYLKIKSDLEKQCKENELLRMNIKLTKLKEYQIQIDVYKKEMEKLRLLFSNSRENINKIMEENNILKEIKNEYLNQHSLINILKKKCEDLTGQIKSLQEENTLLKNEIGKNQQIQKKLKQRNIKLKLSNDKYMKMKKMQEGSFVINKDNIKKIQHLQKDLKEYKSLYEQQNYKYQNILNTNKTKGENILNPDLIKAANFINSKVVEKLVENNQEELYKSLLKEEKIKNNILSKFLKEKGFDCEKILKEKGYDGIIHKNVILNHQSSKNFTSSGNNSQNTKCASSEGNKENPERSKNLNNTQSNLENKYKQSFTQEQLKDMTEENFEINQNNNELTENHAIMTDSQNSDFYYQEQSKKDNQILTLSFIIIKNLEAKHITKDTLIDKIKEISTLFEKKEEITKEDFLKPFIDLFVNLMKITNDKDTQSIQDFFSNLIEETEGDTNKFFLELIDIAQNIVDYTLIENEEEIFNAFAYELLPFKEKLKSNLEKYKNNLITFDSLKNIFDLLKINLSDEYYQYLVYKMKEKVTEKSSIFDLNYKIILDILERNIILNSNSDLQNLSENTNKEENKINEEGNESEENRIQMQIGIAFKELKQAFSDNKTNLEDECKTIIQNFSFNNKKISGIDKDDFFNIFQKYKIEVEEKIKESIFDLFKIENNALESSQNDLTLIDYDKILSFLKN